MLSYMTLRLSASWTNFYKESFYPTLGKCLLLFMLIIPEHLSHDFINYIFYNFWMGVLALTGIFFIYELALVKTEPTSISLIYWETSLPLSPFSSQIFFLAEKSYIHLPLVFVLNLILVLKDFSISNPVFLSNLIYFNTVYAFCFILVFLLKNNWKYVSTFLWHKTFPVLHSRLIFQLVFESLRPHLSQLTFLSASALSGYALSCFLIKKQPLFFLLPFFLWPYATFFAFMYQNIKESFKKYMPILGSLPMDQQMFLLKLVGAICYIIPLILLSMSNILYLITLPNLFLLIFLNNLIKKYSVLWFFLCISIQTTILLFYAGGI